MKAVKKNNSNNIIEMNLIEQLRRNTVPEYFNDNDKQALSDRLKKIVGNALKK